MQSSSVALRRINKELTELRNDIISKKDKDDESKIWSVQLQDNSLVAHATVFMTEPPYKNHGFKLQMEFPVEYPFKPPKLHFKTKIYHLNVDEKGQVCIPIISTEQWKPATKIKQVLQAVINLLCDPVTENPLRAELGEEYIKDKKKYMRNGEDFTKKHAMNRSALDTELQEFLKE